MLQVETWQKLKQRLRPGGRVIANCAQESRMAKAMLQVFEGMPLLLMLDLTVSCQQLIKVYADSADVDLCADTAVRQAVFTCIVIATCAYWCASHHCPANAVVFH